MYELEPWGEERQDLATGIAIMHNALAHSVSAKAPLEYMPFLKKPDPKPQRESLLKETWNAICGMMARAVKKIP